MSADLHSTDTELARLIAIGDKHAFTILYRRHWKVLISTATRVLRSADQAEDIVQEIFYNLWSKREETVITGSVISYLHSSVRYKALNIIGRDIFQKDYLLALYETIELSDKTNAQSQLQLKELELTIKVAINNMPDKMQKVYILSRNEHLTHQQISDRLGISKETVKKHIQHALHLIKNAVKAGFHLLFLLI